MGRRASRDFDPDLDRWVTVAFARISGYRRGRQVLVAQRQCDLLDLVVKQGVDFGTSPPVRGISGYGWLVPAPSRPAIAATAVGAWIAHAVSEMAADFSATSGEGEKQPSAGRQRSVVLIADSP